MDLQEVDKKYLDGKNTSERKTKKKRNLSEVKNLPNEGVELYEDSVSSPGESSKLFD
jgi:hypothetical protein